MPQLFISYARKDNDTPEDNQTGWVSYFYSALEYELQQRGRSDIALWRDRLEIRDYEQFADDIDEGLQSSDIFLAIVSPNYLASDWCARELDRFDDLAGEGRAARERLLGVIKRKIERTETPEPLRGQNGYHFYELNRETKRLSELYHPARGYFEGYWDAVGALADDIDGLLPSNDTPESEDTVEPSTTVFLAVATLDLSVEERRIRGELESRNIRVLPPADLQLPMDSAGICRELQPHLAQSETIIHLLGNTAGFTPEGGDEPIVNLLLSMSAEIKRPRIIWTPPGRDRTSPIQDVIDALGKGNGLGDDDELVGEGFDRLKGFLLERLTAPAPTSEVAEQVARLQAQLEALTRQLGK